MCIRDRLTTFRDYYAINKELLAGLTNQMDSTAQAQLVKQVNEKSIKNPKSIDEYFDYMSIEPEDRLSLIHI